MELAILWQLPVQQHWSVATRAPLALQNRNARRAMLAMDWINRCHSSVCHSQPSMDSRQHQRSDHPVLSTINAPHHSKSMVGQGKWTANLNCKNRCTTAAQVAQRNIPGHERLAALRLMSTMCLQNRSNFSDMCTFATFDAFEMRLQFTYSITSAIDPIDHRVSFGPSFSRDQAERHNYQCPIIVQEMLRVIQQCWKNLWPQRTVSAESYPTMLEKSLTSA